LQDGKSLIPWLEAAAIKALLWNHSLADLYYFGGTLFLLACLGFGGWPHAEVNNSLASDRPNFAPTAASKVSGGKFDS
jgi:hypothetical protein